MTNTTKTQASNTPEDISVSWHGMSTDQVLKTLETPQEEGLTSAEAQRRLSVVGLNMLAEKPRRTFIQLVIDQLKSFVIILLVVAAVISAILGEYVDAGAIIAIVVLNAVLGVVQESRAEEALAALKKMAAPESQVLRDGKRISVPAADHSSR